MSVDTHTAAHPVGRSANAGILFSTALILATVVPFFGIALIPAHPSIIGAVVFILTLGSTHVAATFYLLTDPDIRRFVRARPLRMMLAPCALFAFGMVLFGRFGSVVFCPRRTTVLPVAKLALWCPEHRSGDLCLIERPRLSPQSV